MKRHLAAILAADVVGYSRLMEADEPGTIAALTAHREELIEPKIAEHNGRTALMSGKESEPLSRPDKPSIAVLPFANLSDGPEQEYFADGITENVITELSRFRLLFVIVGCLLLFACADERLRGERLVRFVNEITFGSPWDEIVSKDGHVAKWDGRLRVATTGIGAAEYRPRVSERVAILSQLIGLEATMTEDSEAANVTVSFVPSPDFLVNREHVACYARVETAAGRIVRAQVQVSIARSETIARCLDHELLHALGLRYHSGLVRSVLSPVHEEETLTPWDELALRVLYDTRLEAGTTSEFALPLFREIIAGMSEQR